MKIRLYSIFDKKAEAFNNPFIALNNKMAVRTLVDTLRDPECSFNHHPLDYDLYHVGDFDQTNGIGTLAGPELIVTILDAKRILQSSIDAMNAAMAAKPETEEED